MVTAEGVVIRFFILSARKRLDNVFCVPLNVLMIMIALALFILLLLAW